jgi:hypothetical protein
MAKKAKKKVKKKKRVSAKQKKLGRPPHSFTAHQINHMSQLALSGCQNNTIATIMDIDGETLMRHFKELLTKKRCERKYKLRKLQDATAKKGNPALLIFLGKNELGQADKQDIEHGVTDGLADLMKEIGANGCGLPIKP